MTAMSVSIGRHRPAGQSRGDSGFTLPELLIAVSILALMAPVLAGVLFSGAKVVSGASDTLSAAHGRQLVATQFVTDVQDATAFSTSPACVQGGDVVVAGLTWSQVAIGGTSTTRAASYVLASVDGATALVRRTCSAGVSTGSSVLERAVTSASVSCQSTSYVVVACASFAVLRLTVVDASGSLTITGARRS